MPWLSGAAVATADAQGVADPTLRAVRAADAGGGPIARLARLQEARGRAAASSVRLQHGGFAGRYHLAGEGERPRSVRAVAVAGLASARPGRAAALLA